MFSMDSNIFCTNYLHLALFDSNVLILIKLRSVGNAEICLHFCLHCLHFLHYLHSYLHCLHSLARASMYISCK